MSCNICKHCLAAHLTTPLNINGEPVHIVYILSVVISDSEFEILRSNIENSINTTSGIIKVLCFIEGGNPYEPLKVNISLEDIYEIESIELN